MDEWGWVFCLVGFGVLVFGFFFKAGVKYIQRSLGKDGNTCFFCEKTETIL